MTPQPSYRRPLWREVSRQLVLPLLGPAWWAALLLTSGCQQSANSNSPATEAESAETGNVTFARWDGGPLEVAKGKLSGWPAFTVPDPQVIAVTENLYTPASIALLQRAHVNWIWVTWSVGFSNQTEAPQQALLRTYIAECHQHGIRVTAYMSLGNLFWEDMFTHVPQSREWVLRVNGQPVPYPAADYTAVGHVTRYMADLSAPGWQEYTLARALAAVAAGADGIVFDNALSQYGRPLLEQFTARTLARARQVNPQVFLMTNYSPELAIASRSENAITSEQGWEPGVFTSPAPPPDEWNSVPSYQAVSGGWIVLNAGLLRTLWAVSQGVRPVMVEFSNRHDGDRFLNPMPAAHQKLALAECAAFGSANEQYHESVSLRDLILGQAPVIANWDAVADYNAFFLRNANLYRLPHSLSQIAVVVKSTVNEVAFLNTLATHNLVYDVVFEEDADAVVLAGYRVVVGAPAVDLQPGWRRYEEVSPAEFAAASAVIASAPDTVIMNFHGQLDSDRLLIHLLNYGNSAAHGIDLRVAGHFSRVQWMSPDAQTGSISPQLTADSTQLRVPYLQTYALLVLEP